LTLTWHVTLTLGGKCLDIGEERLGCPALDRWFCGRRVPTGEASTPSMAALGMGSGAPNQAQVLQTPFGGIALDGRRDSRQGFMDRQKVPQKVSVICGLKDVLEIPSSPNEPLLSLTARNDRPSLHIHQKMCRKSTIFRSRSS
jgi:hypothetical protein